MFSDYIGFIDESGDHSLESIDPAYPVFVLSFCIVRKDEYINSLTPRIKRLKCDVFGHDKVILHEYDIRKKVGAFSKLSQPQRDKFFADLTDIVVAIDFRIFAVVIDKQRLVKKYSHPDHPYHMAMQFGLERIKGFLHILGQDQYLTHLICEARGKKEDAELELAFRRVCDGDNYGGGKMPFEIIIADKKNNCEGLQMADLTARPIGLSVIRPNQPNRAMEVMEGKFARSANGNKNGIGLKVFP